MRWRRWTHSASTCCWSISAMPGMNGASWPNAAQMKQHELLRADLMVSGYADSAAVEAVLGRASQLRKPFRHRRARRRGGGTIKIRGSLDDLGADMPLHHSTIGRGRRSDASPPRLVGDGHLVARSRRGRFRLRADRRRAASCRPRWPCVSYSPHARGARPVRSTTVTCCAPGTTLPGASGADREEDEAGIRDPKAS